KVNRESVENFVAKIGGILVIERPDPVCLQTNELRKCVSTPEATGNGVVNKVIIRSIFIHASAYFANNRSLIAKDLRCGSSVQVKGVFARRRKCSSLTRRILDKARKPVVEQQQLVIISNRYRVLPYGSNAAASRHGQGVVTQARIPI